MSGFKLHRLGMLMEPEPGNPQEVEGVLNPAATRGPDGKLYLFPRLVAKGNYSRIGIAWQCSPEPVGKSIILSKTEQLSSCRSTRLFMEAPVKEARGTSRCKPSPIHDTRRRMPLLLTGNYLLSLRQ